MVVYDNERIKEHFARAFYKLGKQGFEHLKLAYLNEEERSRYGAKIFKRKVLGLCGQSTVKSIDELTAILIDLGIAGTNEHDARMDAGLLIKSLNGQEVYYDVLTTLKFEEVENPDKKKAYRITKHSKS